MYLDDIIIYGETSDVHDLNLAIVLEKLKENNFKINIKKLQYKQKKIRLLGSIIDGETQRPIPDKQKKILDFKLPSNKKELQRFLGFTNYYRRYIKNYAVVTAPLEELYKSNEII